MNVVAELTGSTVTTTYLRGLNLIYAQRSSVKTNFCFNAHGDVVQLTDASGNVTKDYHYDAFGNEYSPDESDTNPFRYCGEYYDLETNTYYLRARYYDPATGRFLTEDSYWDVDNSIYGDDPLTMYDGVVKADRDFYWLLAQQLLVEKFVGHIFRQTGMTATDKILEVQRWRIGRLSEDELQLIEDRIYNIKHPSISAIMQSTNLYCFAMNDPIIFQDPSGSVVVLVIAGVTITAGMIVAVGIGLVVLLDLMLNNGNFTTTFLEGIYRLGYNAVDALKHAAEHTKNARPSTENKHEKGQKRVNTDKQGGEKGDVRRTPRNPKRK